MANRRKAKLHFVSKSSRKGDHLVFRIKAREKKLDLFLIILFGAFMGVPLLFFGLINNVIWQKTILLFLSALCIAHFSGVGLNYFGWMELNFGKHFSFKRGMKRLNFDWAQLRTFTYTEEIDPSDSSNYLYTLFLTTDMGDVELHHRMIDYEDSFSFKDQVEDLLNQLNEVLQQKKALAEKH